MEQNITIKGKITQILPVESGTSKAGKEWNKGGFIIDNGDTYNPNVFVGLFGDKLDLLVNKSVGMDVVVHVNVSSREFNGKWYTQCDGWRIDLFGQSKPNQEQPKQSQTQQSNDVDDDLPF